MQGWMQGKTEDRNRCCDVTGPQKTEGRPVNSTHVSLLGAGRAWFSGSSPLSFNLRRLQGNSAGSWWSVAAVSARARCPLPGVQSRC